MVAPTAQMPVQAIAPAQMPVQAIAPAQMPLQPVAIAMPQANPMATPLVVAAPGQVMLQQPGLVVPGQLVAQPMGHPMAKSKLAAGLIAIFFGAFGVHNFYLGYTGKGIAQLLITVLSFGLLAFVSWIWALIEGIMILAGSIAVDANGIPLKD
jgi:TM2 domain-containing membrane protein YozV